VLGWPVTGSIFRIAARTCRTTTWVGSIAIGADGIGIGADSIAIVLYRIAIVASGIAMSLTALRSLLKASRCR